MDVAAAPAPLPIPEGATLKRKDVPPSEDVILGNRYKRIKARFPDPKILDAATSMDSNWAGRFKCDADVKRVELPPSGASTQTDGPFFKEFLLDFDGRLRCFQRGTKNTAFQIFSGSVVDIPCPRQIHVYAGKARLSDVHPSELSALIQDGYPLRVRSCSPQLCQGWQVLWERERGFAPFRLLFSFMDKAQTQVDSKAAETPTTVMEVDSTPPPPPEHIPTTMATATAPAPPMATATAPAPPMATATAPPPPRRNIDVWFDQMEQTMMSRDMAIKFDAWLVKGLPGILYQFSKQYFSKIVPEVIT